MYDPALALVEFSSIAAGIQAADAMVKRAPMDTTRAGTVQPGKYLVLIGGLTADVEESLAAGRELGAEAVVDFVYLPRVHPEVVEARLADGVGGKGITLLSGLVEDVEAAVDIGVGALARPALLVRQGGIPQLHEEMWDNLGEATRFRSLVTERV